ncbi:LacI family DNA-binding transcriptional regulator [Nonomuraea sp. PA05]|uniref:LacI family DNA-binding transcriptional regulator n=1 Tax=Nonomuraea sp. PA05 TaxID=2604466 RepID=UPI001CA31E9C|nr:LacI family DNA-binding transcriptional regulator [Nonomuraea sp. PA05]
MTEQSLATMADVAARAGVSSATVSRVINGNYPVSAATRQRVEQAIADLGYVANAHARALAGATNRTVGIIISDLIDPFYAYIARGVEREATKHGRLCMVSCTHGSHEQELALIDLLHEQRADAVILVGGAYEDRSYAAQVARRARALHASGSTLVLCGRPSLGEDVPTRTVEYDNEGGAFAITDYLITQGHRRIVFLGGPPHLSTTIARLAGHRRALRFRGLPQDKALIHTGQLNRRFGYDRMRALLAEPLDFTAVFCANDTVAAGAMQALELAGVSVPEGMSVVGYDDVPIAQELRPQLTTVRIPLEEMGRQAVRVGLDVTEDNDYLSPVQTTAVVGTHIVVRASVAPLR